MERVNVKGCWYNDVLLETYIIDSFHRKVIYISLTISFHNGALIYIRKGQCQLNRDSKSFEFRNPGEKKNQFCGK